MFGNRQLESLEQRKAELLKQSAKNRALLQAETPKLQAVAQWVDLGIGVAQKARAGWAALSPWISPPGIGAQEPKPVGFASILRYGISAARSLMGVWKAWR